MRGIASPLEPIPPPKDLSNSKFCRDEPVSIQQIINGSTLAPISAADLAVFSRKMDARLGQNGGISGAFEFIRVVSHYTAQYPNKLSHLPPIPSPIPELPLIASRQLPQKCTTIVLLPAPPRPAFSRKETFSFSSGFSQIEGPISTPAGLKFTFSELEVEGADIRRIESLEDTSPLSIDIYDPLFHPEVYLSPPITPLTSSIIYLPPSPSPRGLARQSYSRSPFFLSPVSPISPPQQLLEQEPIRIAFESIVERFLSIDSIYGLDKLLPSSLVRTALSEARYSTNPAIFIPLTNHLYLILNKILLPPFLIQSSYSLTSSTALRRLLLSFLFFLFTLISTAGLIFIPFSISRSHDKFIIKEIPRSYRFLLFPFVIISIGLLLIAKTRICFYLVFRNKREWKSKSGLKRLFGISGRSSEVKDERIRKKQIRAVVKMGILWMLGSFLLMFLILLIPSVPL